MSDLDKCEGCDRYMKLTPFGEHDSMLCDTCFGSAYFHSRPKNKGYDCGYDECRVCNEPEE